MSETNDTEKEEFDPSVPADLLDLHVQLEEAEMSPKRFKEVYGGEASNQS